MKVINKKISDLKPAEYNPRKISVEQLGQLKKSLEGFECVEPAVVNKNPSRVNVIVGGHQRIKAAKELGWKEFPCVEVDLTLEKEKELNIRLNKNSGEFDFEILEADFDIEDLVEWGFDEEDFDLEAEELGEVEGEDDVPEPPEKPITKLGDVWILGEHRLLCGDSTSIDAVDKLMAGNKADLLHTDPPYNVDYSNANRPKAGKTDLGKIKNDMMDGEKFYSFLYDSFICAFQALSEDSTAYVWHASSEHVNFTNALVDAGFKYTQQVIWKKPMLLGRGRYQWAHEPCLMGVKGSPFFTDDRTKTTVWDFGGYDKSKNIHPTQKPVFIPEEAVSNSSKKGDIVLDLFGGSGSTLIACEKTKRKCFMIELDEKYCDVIIKRWQEFTGKSAILEETGEVYGG